MRLTRWLFPLAVSGLMASSGCERMPIAEITSLKSDSLAALSHALLSRPPALDQFRARGPFDVEVRSDLELTIGGGERFTADAYLSSVKDPAPLVIILHGYGNSKANHSYQGAHLASWGMHTLALQLPNNGPWVRNGETLARLVRYLQRQPGVVGGRVDPHRIVLVGHSFGGTSVAVALAAGAPAAGGVLLDPAGISRSLPQHLQKIVKPVIVLASDPSVTHTRRREEFYEYVAANIGEISVRDAAHEDAQFSLDPPPRDPESDEAVTEELQITFVSALTAAALSLALTGKLDFAWASFAPALRDGQLFDAARK
jgi:pimeloyl-ACP methyl ester carboxylesterase